MSQIDLGEFMKFCKDFEIPLPKLKIQEVFKKSCIMGHKPLKFEQFDGSLTRLAVDQQGEAPRIGEEAQDN